MAADNPDEPPPEGRPMDRGLARKHAFLEAARKVFLEHGYQAASVNDVVRSAGGSLATLYLQFQNKDGLFTAVLLDQDARFTRSMAPENVDHLPLKEALCAIGERFLRALMEPENLAFFRLLIGESQHFPEAARKNVGVGAEQVRDVVSSVLRKHGLATDDDVLASQLLELWRSRYHYRALTDPSFRLADDELKRHVARGVDVLMHGAVGPR